MTASVSVQLPDSVMLSLVKWKDQKIIHCRIMTVHQLISAKISWVTARQNKAMSASPVVLIVYQGKWHVWKCWKCVTCRLHLLPSKRIGARERSTEWETGSKIKRSNKRTVLHFCFLLNWLLKNKHRNKQHTFQTSTTIISTSISALCLRVEQGVALDTSNVLLKLGLE